MPQAQVNNLKLVSINREDSKLRAIRRIHDRFSIVYRSWHVSSLELKDSTNAWLECLKDHSADTILFALDAILKGKTAFNSNPPTPMSFASLCNDLENPKLGSSLSTKDIFRMFE